MDFDSLLKPFKSYSPQKHTKRNAERLNELLAQIENAAEAKKAVSKLIDDSVKQMGKEVRNLRKKEDKLLQDMGILPAKKRAA